MTFSKVGTHTPRGICLNRNQERDMTAIPPPPYSQLWTEGEQGILIIGTPRRTHFQEVIHHLGKFN